LSPIGPSGPGAKADLTEIACLRSLATTSRVSVDFLSSWYLDVSVPRVGGVPFGLDRRDQVESSYPVRIRQFGFYLIPVHCPVIPSDPFVILGFTLQIAADFLLTKGNQIVELINLEHSDQYS
jgi:hypothetical protein